MCKMVLCKSLHTIISIRTHFLYNLEQRNYFEFINASFCLNHCTKSSCSTQTSQAVHKYHFFILDMFNSLLDHDSKGFKLSLSLGNASISPLNELNRLNFTWRCSIYRSPSGPVMIIDLLIKTEFTGSSQVDWTFMFIYGNYSV